MNMQCKGKGTDGMQTDEQMNGLCQGRDERKKTLVNKYHKTGSGGGGGGDDLGDLH